MDLPRFVPVRRLGQGGSGVVYEAWDRQLEIAVALKRLRRQDPRSIFWLKREFRSLQDVRHPNLVRLFELLCEKEEWFFTMELVEGENLTNAVSRPGQPRADSPAASPGWDRSTRPLALDDVVASSEPPSPPQVDIPKLRNVLTQMAEGLEALHAAGKVHRDVKPANVLVTPRGRVVVLDFGLVTPLQPDVDVDELTACGTLAYMAPEQFWGGVLGASADWYAVGVMLYEVFSGRLPYTGTARELMRAKKASLPPPLTDIALHAPDDLCQLCMDLLEPEPRARPDTDEILRRLGAMPRVSKWNSGADSIPFVGRQAQRKQMREAAHRALSGFPVFVLIEGESGVGKTALMREGLKDIAAQHPTALRLSSRCQEQESIRFKALDGIVDGLTRRLGQLPLEELRGLLPRRAELLPRLFPVFGQLEVFSKNAPTPLAPHEDPAEIRTRSFSAFGELLGRVAERLGLVLTIDDLQWADSDSRALLQHVFRAGEAPALLLVATFRNFTHQSVGPPQLEIETQRVVLDPLPPEDARSLASCLQETEGTPTNVADIANESKGHPLFILELVRHARVGGKGERPLRLDEAIRSRAAALDDGLREILRLLCLAGRPLAHGVLARALDAGPPGALLHALQRLWSERLAHGLGLSMDGWSEPYHDRVREALQMEISSFEQARLHSLLARALEIEGVADAERLAHHWAAAGQRAKAADYALIAAEQAQAALAFERAAALYQRALELRPEPLDTHAHKIALANALAGCGRSAEAGSVYLRASETADEITRLELRRKAAEQLLRAGDCAKGLAVVREMTREVDVHLPRAPLAAALSTVALRSWIGLRGFRYTARDEQDVSGLDLRRIDVCMSAGMGLSLLDPVRGSALHARSLLLALKTGEVSRLARMFALEGAYRGFFGGRAARRVDGLIRQAEGLAERSQDVYTRLFVLGNKGVARLFQGRPQEARTHMTEALEGYERHRLTANYERATLRYFLMTAFQIQGSFRDIQTQVNQQLAQASSRHDGLVAADFAPGAAALWQLSRDNVSEARTYSGLAAQLWPSGRFSMRHWVDLWVQASCDLYAGSYPAAHERIERAWDALACSGIFTLLSQKAMAYDLRARAVLGAAALARGQERERLLKKAQRFVRRVARSGAIGEFQLPLLAAATAYQLGGPEAAVAPLQHAAEWYRARSSPFPEMVARWWLGKWVGGAGGKAHLATARKWLEQEGVVAPERMVLFLAPGFTNLSGFSGTSSWPPDVLQT